MHKKNIFEAAPYINILEKKYINKTLRSKEISTYGKLNILFEKKISKIINLKYTTSVTSGSVALFIAFKVLEIQNKDIVITSTYTFVSTINSIIHAGGTPYIIDIDKTRSIFLERLAQIYASGFDANDSSQENINTLMLKANATKKAVTSFMQWKNASSDIEDIDL